MRQCELHQAARNERVACKSCFTDQTSLLPCECEGVNGMDKSLCLTSDITTTVDTSKLRLVTFRLKIYKSSELLMRVDYHLILSSILVSPIVHSAKTPLRV